MLFLKRWNYIVSLTYSEHIITISHFEQTMTAKNDKDVRLEKRAAALKENMRRRKDLKKQKELSKDDSPKREKSD